MIRETGTAGEDGTTLSELMECFLKKEVDNPKFPAMTNRMNFLKHQEGGLEAVCEVMEKYEKKAAVKAAAKAAEEANVRAIRKMITDFHASKDNILQDYSEEEYSIALRELKAEKTNI